MAIIPSCCGCKDASANPGFSQKYSQEGPSLVHSATVRGAKYLAGSGATFNFPPNAGCTIVSAAGGAVAADREAKQCWGVTGLPVVIEDRDFTVMKGFEMVNFNFHVMGTTQAVASNYLLNMRGAVS